MESCGVEVWDEDGEFIHTAITVRDGNAVWYGETQERGPVEELRPRIQLSLVPSEELYPIRPNEVKSCDSKIDVDQMHVKRPDCRAYGQVRGSQALAKEFLDEIRIYEQVSTRPHRNLVQYHGCLLHGGRAVGIVLDPYVCTLHERRASMDFASRLECFNSVKAGLTHLHNFGLAHNDINPTNIMFDKDGRTVIIDYDSCAPQQVALVKTGMPGWNDGFSEYSSFSNDEWALHVLKEYLALH